MGVAVLLVVSVAGAEAAKPISSVYETQVLPAAASSTGAQRSERPKCGGGATSVAGGFELAYRIGDPAPPQMSLTTFRRDQDAWFLNAINYGPGGGDVTTYVYCARLEVSISFVAKRAPGTVLENSAKCPRGKLALSGGFVLDTAHNVPYALKRTSKRSWSVASTNPGGAEAGLTAYVVCAKKASGLRLKQVRAVVPLAPSSSGATATAVASCPAGSRVLSGGFEVPTFASGVLVHDSKRVGDRSWEVSASSQTPAMGSVVSYAYCV